MLQLVIHAAFKLLPHRDLPGAFCCGELAVLLASRVPCQHLSVGEEPTKPKLLMRSICKRAQSFPWPCLGWGLELGLELVTDLWDFSLYLGGVASLRCNKIP